MRKCDDTFPSIIFVIDGQSLIWGRHADELPRAAESGFSEQLFKMCLFLQAKTVRKRVLSFATTSPFLLLGIS